MLPNELPSPGLIPGAPRLHSEVRRAIDYARRMAVVSPDQTTANELRDFFRAAALLLPAKSKPTAPKKDQE